MADFLTTALQSMRLPSACCATSCSAVRIVPGAYLRGEEGLRIKTLARSEPPGGASGGRVAEDEEG